jgi:hypothetical protein
MPVQGLSIPGSIGMSAGSIAGWCAWQELRGKAQGLQQNQKQKYVPDAAPGNQCHDRNECSEHTTGKIKRHDPTSRRRV